ncbi:MAG: M56 family metallopeptidase [Asticcacaulis sp.]|uniref:M56 family metallopeptidase n=1 Tax=Asticcacaulis sp. TaxID=1872648 RepID=UPI003F7B5363
MNTHLTALGLTLLHVGWQALLVAALYRLCELCLTRLSDRARYRLGLAAMMTVLALALATFVYEEVRLANTPMPTSAALATPVMAPQILTQLTPWLDLAWALGVVVLSLRLIGGLWFIARLPRAALPADPALTRRFEAMAATLGLTGKVALRLHPRIDGPFVTGVLRSVVYLPLSAVTMLTPAQLDAVLSHELEHVLRRDYAWNLAQSLVEILFFFHPAVWWLGGRLREQRELICDDAALLACRDPLVYATALLQLEEGRRQAAPAAPRLAPSLAMALNGHRRNLFWRIARMLDEETGEHPSSSRLLRAAGAVLALPLAVALLAAFAPPVAQTVARTAENLAPQPKESQPKEKIKDATRDSKDCPPTAVKDVEIDAKDVIDADAVAEQARQAVLAAKASFKIQIDADKIAAEARRAAQSERDQQIAAGHIDIDIDPDAIAQQARSEAVKAQIEAAKTAVASIDADKIAAQVRVEMKKSQVEIRRAKAEAAKVKTYRWVIQYDVPPSAPETPAPLAEVAPPTPPMPPAPQPARPASPPDIALTVPAIPPAPAAPKVAAPAPPAPPASPAARALPAAKASALPAPSASEDRIVILAER